MSWFGNLIKGISGSTKKGDAKQQNRELGRQQLLENNPEFMKGILDSGNSTMFAPVPELSLSITDSKKLLQIQGALGAAGIAFKSGSYERNISKSDEPKDKKMQTVYRLSMNKTEPAVQSLFLGLFLNTATKEGGNLVIPESAEIGKPTFPQLLLESAGVQYEVDDQYNIVIPLEKQRGLIEKLQQEHTLSHSQTAPNKWKYPDVQETNAKIIGGDLFERNDDRLVQALFDGGVSDVGKKDSLELKDLKRNKIHLLQGALKAAGVDPKNIEINEAKGSINVAKGTRGLEVFTKQMSEVESKYIDDMARIMNFSNEDGVVLTTSNAIHVSRVESLLRGNGIPFDTQQTEEFEKKHTITISKERIPSVENNFDILRKQLEEIQEQQKQKLLKSQAIPQLTPEELERMKTENHYFVKGEAVEEVPQQKPYLTVSQAAAEQKKQSPNHAYGNRSDFQGSEESMYGDMSLQFASESVNVNGTDPQKNITSQPKPNHAYGNKSDFQNSEEPIYSNINPDNISNQKPSSSPANATKISPKAAKVLGIESSTQGTEQPYTGENRRNSQLGQQLRKDVDAGKFPPDVAKKIYHGLMEAAQGFANSVNSVADSALKHIGNLAHKSHFSSQDQNKDNGQSL